MERTEPTTTLTRRTVLAGLGATAVGIGLGRPVTAGAQAADLGFPDGWSRMVKITPGAWCVWPEQRAVMHPDGRLFVGVVRPMPEPKVSQIEVVSADTTHLRVRERFVVHRITGRSPDDHWSPGLRLIDGKVQTGWALHSADNWVDVGPSLRVPLTRVRAAPRSFACYVQNLTTNGRRWVAYRDTLRGWSLMSSSSTSQPWTIHGPLVLGDVEGRRPYVRFRSDGERLHFVASDGHPEQTASLYGGVVHADLSITDSGGRPLGAVGTAPVDPRVLSPIRAGRANEDLTVAVTNRCVDLVLLDGHLQAVISAREPGPTTASPPNGAHWHRYHLARSPVGSGTWTVEPLAWAGSELAARHPDYVGLAVTDPTRPDRVVVSTDVDPRTGTTTTTGRWQLWEGVRAPETPGAPWRWRPLTADRVHDNLRPVIATEGPHKALAWMRGSYRSYFDFTTEICARRAR